MCTIIIQVLGVDILGTAVEEAERNALVNRLGHCSYITGNVEDTIPRMVQAAKHEEVSRVKHVSVLRVLLHADLNLLNHCYVPSRW